MSTKKTKQFRADEPTHSAAAKFTVPGISTKHGQRAAEVLQERLVALIDLKLTLKHIHWNVVGPAFIGVHMMLDPQVDGVAAMIDKKLSVLPPSGRPRMAYPETSLLRGSGTTTRCCGPLCRNTLVLSMLFTPELSVTTVWPWTTWKNSIL